MRKLIVSMNITLDGYLSGPNCDLDWHFKYWTKEMGDALCSQLAKADTILLGKVTYTAMEKYWPSKVADPACRGEDFAFANMMNTYVKIVFSKTITSAEWNNSKLLTGNLPNEIGKLKSKPGKDIMVYGSSKLTDALIQYDLVDEFQLWVHPVILGKGNSLFKQSKHKLYLKMMNTTKFSSGVVMLHYQIIKINKNDNDYQTSKRRILKREL